MRFKAVKYSVEHYSSRRQTDYYEYSICVGLYRMHRLWTSAINNPVAWGASVNLCHAPAPCQTAKRIDVLFGVETSGDQEIFGPDPPEKRIRRRRHQITLTACNMVE